MKTNLTIACLVVFLSACSTTQDKKESPSAAGDLIGSQKLSSNFKRQGVKLEWECSWGTGFSEATCSKGDVKAIEVTAYAPSFGNSEANREAAFGVAHDMALVKLNRFISDEVTTSRVTNTLIKNIEKANDKLKSKISTQEVISVADDDSFSDSNIASRENTNEVIRTVTESIRTQSSGILRGVRSVDEKIVDRQTVAVTVRWDKDSEKAVQELRRRIR
jgi:hypothetical protein